MRIPSLKKVVGVTALCALATSILTMNVVFGVTPVQGPDNSGYVGPTFQNVTVKEKTDTDSAVTKKLTVNGDSSMYGDVKVTGMTTSSNATVGGILTVGSTLDAITAKVNAKDLDIVGLLRVGSISAVSNAIVNILNNLKVTGYIEATGDATVGKDLTVSGKTTAKNGINIGGTVEYNPVAQTFALTDGGLSGTASITMDGQPVSPGGLTAVAVKDLLLAFGDVFSLGNLTANDITASKNLKAKGSLTSDGNLLVKGTSTFEGMIIGAKFKDALDTPIIKNTVDFYEPKNVADPVMITGDLVLYPGPEGSGNKGDLYVNGDASVAGNLYVSGKLGSTTTEINSKAMPVAKGEMGSTQVACGKFQLLTNCGFRLQDTNDKTFPGSLSKYMVPIDTHAYRQGEFEYCSVSAYNNHPAYTQYLFARATCLNMIKEQ